jgi:hypothetical protein
MYAHLRVIPLPEPHANYTFVGTRTTLQNNDTPTTVPIYNRISPR